MSFYYHKTNCFFGGEKSENITFFTLLCKFTCKIVSWIDCSGKYESDYGCDLGPGLNEANNIWRYGYRYINLEGI